MATKYLDGFASESPAMSHLRTWKSAKILGSITVAENLTTHNTITCNVGVDNINF